MLYEQTMADDKKRGCSIALDSPTNNNYWHKFSDLASSLAAAAGTTQSDNQDSQVPTSPAEAEPQDPETQIPC